MNKVFHRTVIALAAGFAFLVTANLAVSQEGRSRLLQQPIDTELLETRTKIELELDGKLLVEDKSSQQTGQPKSIPLKATAKQDYVEAIAFEEASQKAAARRYRTAEVRSWIAGKEIAQSLNVQRAETRLVEHMGTWEQYCPSQPMDQREVELLRTPINTAMLERILPIEPARTNSTWALSDEDLRCLLNLEAVHKANVQARIAGVESNMVKIEFQGTVDATIDSVSTAIELRGNAQVKSGSKGHLVSWLGISIKERREISQRRPGFDLTARIELIRQEMPGELKFDRQALLGAADAEDASRWLVKLESVPGKFSTFVERDWIAYVDGSEDSVLRLIDNNQSIAQCNITQLAKLDAGTQLTLEGMEADVRSSLGERFGELIESNEKITTAQLRLLRIEVESTEEGVPVRRVYAHLSDDSGRRLSLVFTLAAQYAERFSGSDIQLLDSLEFTGIATTSDEPPQSARLSSPETR